MRLWDVNKLKNSPNAEPVILTDDTVTYSVAFSPDGSLLGGVGAGSLTIWSTKTGQPTRVLQTPTGPSSCLAFSPDGRTLAIGGDDGDLCLHDIATATKRAVLRGHSNAVRSLSFSRDGRFLVSAAQDSLIMLWDVERGVSIRALLEGSSNPNHVVAFAPDGGSVAVGEIGGGPTDVLVIDPKDGAIRKRLRGHKQGVCALAFSPEGRTLATAGNDHSVKVWNLADCTEQTTFSNDLGSVNSLSFSTDGAWLAFAGDGLAIKVWDRTGTKSPRLGFLPLTQPDGMSVTIGNSDEQLRNARSRRRGPRQLSVPEGRDALTVAR